MQDQSAWHVLLDSVAALVLVVGGAVFVGLAWLQRGRSDRPTVAAKPVGSRAERLSGRVSLTVFIATLSAGAGIIHLASMPAHLEELGLLGAGFVVAGTFQLAWALAYLVGRRRSMALVGIAGNAAILVAWTWSRTIGLPVGPLGWQAEAIGTADAAATMFEVLIVGLLAARLTRARSLAQIVRAETARLRQPAGAATIATVLAIGLVFFATALAVSAALGGHSHGDRPHVDDHDHGPATSGIGTSPFPGRR